MKIIMVAAISKDGFITKGDNPSPRAWTSLEDQKHLTKLLSENSLHVFGSTTYDVYKPLAHSSSLRVILTNTPSSYSSESILNHLEFRALSPLNFVLVYAPLFKSCLILGGPFVYSTFMEAGLVDEIYLTVEPVINESGLRLFTKGRNLEDFDVPVPATVELNATGTLLRHYVLNN